MGTGKCSAFEKSEEAIFFSFFPTMSPVMFLDVDMYIAVTIWKKVVKWIVRYFLGGDIFHVLRLLLIRLTTISFSVL